MSETATFRLTILRHGVTWFGAQVKQQQHISVFSLQIHTAKLSSEIWYSEGLVSINDTNVTNLCPFEHKSYKSWHGPYDKSVLRVTCTHFSVWRAHISQCDVHTFLSVRCTHFRVWRAYISQCDVHTFHTTGSLLIVRYWHSSAAVTHTKVWCAAHSSAVEQRGSFTMCNAVQPRYSWNSIFGVSLLRIYPS